MSMSGGLVTLNTEFMFDLSITKVSYANSLDPDETPLGVKPLGVSPDPSCLTLRQRFVLRLISTYETI